MRTLQRTTSHYRTPQHSEVAISQYETTCCTAVVSVVTDIHTHASYLQLWVLSLTNTTHARTFAQTHTYTGLIPAVVSVVTDVHPHYTQASYLRLWVLPLTNTHTHTTTHIHRHRICGCGRCHWHTRSCRRYSGRRRSLKWVWSRAAP